MRAKPLRRESGGATIKTMADIRHSIQISATPEAVYQLAATADGFAQWWAEDVTEDEGKVQLGFFNRTTIYRLKPIVEAPHERIEWQCETGQEWSGTGAAVPYHPGGQRDVAAVHACGLGGGDGLFRFVHDGLGRVDVPAEGGGGGQAARSAVLA